MILVRDEAGEKPFILRDLTIVSGYLLGLWQSDSSYIFLEEYRNFYSLESLWADAKLLKPLKIK